MEEGSRKKEYIEMEERNRKREDSETEEMNNKKSTTTTHEPPNPSSQAKQQRKKSAKISQVNSITDLKTFLAKKKTEREKKLMLGPQLTRDSLPTKKTTQVVNLCPSNIKEREDEVLRQTSEQDALETAAEQ